MSAGPSISHIERLDLAFTPKVWRFAAGHRADIDAHFAALRRDKPALWNGSVLLMHEHMIDDDVLRGAFLETDYASFRFWRDQGSPEAGVHDCFGAAALIAADGACLLGVMGSHTANAGQIYCPCGTPGPEDIAGAKVDLDFSVSRELMEETGLSVAEFRAEPGWTTVLDTPLIANIKVLHSRESADVLRGRILDHLKRERQPELSDIRIVRSPGEFESAMPAFVTAFLTHFWR